MSNQEMQFADPDWKPSQQLDTKTNPGEREAYNPQPVNTDYREQSQWRTVPPSPPQQEGYSGLRPYAGTAPQQMQGQGGNFRQQRYRRRGRGPWFWIIAAIILISLMSGGFGFHSGSGFGHDRFGQIGPNHIVEKHYTVNGQPTIVINDTNGNVTVTEGQSNTDVTIQAMNENNPFGNPNAIQPNISQDSANLNLINASVPDGQQGSVDFHVTVPQGTNLRLQTDSGNINVTGVDGQMTLTTNSGSIDASNDVINGSSAITTNSGEITAKQTTLSDQATISTDSGSINFDGTIGTTGTYRFQTNSGSVDLNVPSTSAFHVEASTTSGSIDIPGVNPQNNGSGAKAIGDVGGSSSQQGAKLIINTENGDINLHQS